MTSRRVPTRCKAVFARIRFRAFPPPIALLRRGRRRLDVAALAVPRRSVNLLCLWRSTMTRPQYLVLAMFFGLAGVAYGQAAKAPEGTPVRCKDGTMGTAGRGACSHHGGIAKDDAAATPRAAPTPAPATRKTTPTAAPATPTPGATARRTTPAAAPAAPTGATVTVRCKDGTTSEAGRGACSHHGGVDKGGVPAPAPTPTPAPTPPPTAAPLPPAQPAPMPTPTAPPAPTTPPAASNKPLPPNAVPPAQGAPTAKCKDGSLSYSKHHSGTCSNHGGVDTWLDGTPPKQ
jgi:hypothetical protein